MVIQYRCPQASSHTRTHVPGSWDSNHKLLFSSLLAFLYYFASPLHLFLVPSSPLFTPLLSDYPPSSYWIGYISCAALHSPPLGLPGNDNKIEISRYLSVYYLPINTSDTLPTLEVIQEKAWSDLRGKTERGGRRREGGRRTEEKEKERRGS